MKKLDFAHDFISSMEDGSLLSYILDNEYDIEWFTMSEDDKYLNTERFIEILHKIRNNIEDIMVAGLLNEYIRINDVSEPYLCLEYNDSGMNKFLKLLVKEKYINIKDYNFLLSQQCFRIFENGYSRPLHTLEFEHRDGYKVYAFLVDELEFYLSQNFSKGESYE